MQENSYLIFELNGDRYAFPSACVKEVFALPELLPGLERFSDDSTIAGAINLRGILLPVIDLKKHLPSYQLTNVVLVLKSPDALVGLIVDEVHDVQVLSLERLDPNAEQIDPDLKPLIVGTAGTDDKVYILQNPESWINSQQILSFLEQNADRSTAQFVVDSALSEPPRPNRTLTSLSELETAKQEVFRKRASNLKSSVSAPNSQALKSIAVIRLGKPSGSGGNAVWGIHVGMIREFVDIEKITPVPCCPPHIIGNTNLRGAILTIVDIRGFLNIPQTKLPTAFKAMIVEIENFSVGVFVEGVQDAMFLLNQQNVVDVKPSSNSRLDEYVQGAAPYGEETMIILDLSKLLREGDLVVDEAI